MISRKAFIAASSIAPLAMRAQPASARTPAASAFVFDEARYKAILATPAAHKMCFGSTYSGGGEVLFLMNNLLNAYDDRSNQPHSTHTIAVLYHGASFTMALDDSFWKDVLAPYVKKGGSEAAQLWGDVSHNPYLSDPDAAATIDSLAARGANFLVCRNALTENAQDFAKTMGWHPADVYRKAVAALVPSALIVPAGVMAICDAQQAGYAYLQATLS